MLNSFQRFIFEFKTKFLKPKLYRAHLESERALHTGNLDQLNLQKRNALVRHAFENSSFYQKKYTDSDIDISAIATEADFGSLPIVTREEVRKSFEDFKIDKVSKKHYYKITTSGSSGPPISVLHDKRFPLAPLQWRLLQWWGLPPYENKAFIYRYHRSLIKKVWNTILWWPTKRIFLAGSEMDDVKIKKFITSFNRTKPTLLQGYVDVVYEFALYLKDNKIEIYPPKAVWVTSAPLTNQQRAIMEDVFKAPVYDQYGSTEVMVISAECKAQKGLHIMQDVVFVECVDENNKPVPANTWGKILLTDLQNHVFPLIRYEIGDYGRLLDHKCSCGLNLPLMENVRGRETDIISTPSGLKVYGDFLTTIFDEFPNSVRSFQIVQLKDFSIELFYVPMKGKKMDSVIKSVIGKFKQKVNSEIPIAAIPVDKIQRINGKTQIIINHLK